MDKQASSGIGGLFVVIAVVCIAFAMSSHAPTNATKHQAAQVIQNVTSSSDINGFAVQGPPTIPASFIDKVLCAAGSPACHSGQALYNDGVQYGIDPAFALAFFQHESTFGLYGIAHDNQGLGNIRCSAGYTCKHGFRAYASWADGYADWYKLISWYVSDLHKSTLDQIIPTYAPAVENNTLEYIASIKKAVASWRQEASAA